MDDVHPEVTSRSSVPESPRRAVVIGAGVAGVAAAASLARAGWAVEVLERDRFTDERSHRRGVPQASQLHNLLERAQRGLDRLLPGFTDALLDAGGGRASVAGGTHVFELGVRMPERDLGLSLVCATRPMIDHVARDRLRAVHGITASDGTRVTGLAFDRDAADNARVAGVTVEDGSGARMVPSGIVVDASGSATALPRWLAAAGIEPPELEERSVRQWYATAVYRRSPSDIGSERAWMVFPFGDCDRGALVSPLGAQWWCVSVSGHDPDPPPATGDDLVRHAASLPDSSVRELLRRSTIAEAPAVFRKPVATWRRYDLWEPRVTGLLPVGDAVASLNPLFGQGMSVATWQAEGLADALTDSTDLADLTVRHHRLAGAAVRAAWTLAALAEGPVEQFLDAVAPGCGSVDELANRIAADLDFHRWYVSLWHLLEPLPTVAPTSVGG